MDLIGQTFGRLTVISQAETRKERRFWHCRCECGSEIETYTARLTTGHTRSCGCFHRDVVREVLRAANTKHGLWKTPEYQSWNDLRHRCLNPSRHHYDRYGGRGITICDRWRDSFEAFLEDMGPRPGAGYSIERKDNAGNYEPSNCRWATAKEQSNNRRSSRLITINGVTQSVAIWADSSGIPRNTVYHRLDRGYTPEQALGMS